MLLLGPVELGPRRFERRFGDPPFGAHRRLAGEQFGERGLGFARRGLGSRQLGRNPRRLRFVVAQPLIDRRRAPASSWAIGRGRIALQRLLALDVGGERSVEPIELGEPASDRVAPRARRRQLMRELVRRARAASASALRRSVKRRAAPILRLLRFDHRAPGSLRPRPPPPAPRRRGGRRLLGLDPAGVKQPRLDASGSWSVSLR